MGCASACACLSRQQCALSSSHGNPAVPGCVCLGTASQPHADWTPRASSWEQIPADTGWQQVSSPHVSKGKSPLSSCPCSKFPTGFPKYQSTFAYSGGKHCSALLFVFLAFCSVLCICPWHLANDHRNPNGQTVSKILMGREAEEFSDQLWLLEHWVFSPFLLIFTTS